MGVIRKRLLTPDLSEVTFQKRGFHERDRAVREKLEHVGRQFLTGFGHAMASRDVDEAGRLLDAVERPYRGFAYEGAAMAYAISGAMIPGKRRHLHEFAAGPAAPHVYMVHVGIGWAMARLPRLLWGRILLPDPLLRWLAFDGYGFHQAYFATRAYVDEGRAPTVRAPWPDPSGYTPRAVDQGIGRALWFVCGADVERLGVVIDGFAPARRGDLWSGAGLAATYAGGVGADDLDLLVKLATGYRRELAQGSAFAAKARLLADLVLPHTGEATRVLCGLSVEDAARLTDEALIDLPASTLPAFEVWRRRIQANFDGLEDETRR
ncbi:MAG TPA: DUF1702 family protein [Streptosporangiaceae bacterium]|nr:DUF1702 family protein [Streptosporangiaceae bacterium]